MKKAFLGICTLIISIFILTGCTTSISYTFKVETGDTIKITLNTTDGYKMSSNVPFEISKDDKVLSQGTFITIDSYSEYEAAIESDEDAKVIEKSEKNNLTYIFYSYNDTEFNYVIKINNSNTGLLLGNNVSLDSAKEIFNNLEFSIE